MEELLNFKGKIGRLEYFQISIFCYLMLLAFILTISELFKPGSSNAALWLLIMTLILVGCIVAIKLAAVTKRLNDIGLNPSLTLLIFVPVLNIIFSVFLLFAKEKKDETDLNSEPEEKSEVKICSYCCAKIPAHAKKCMYCGEWVDFSAFEEEENKPRSYWTINIILSVLIVGLCIYCSNTQTTNIFSKDIFKTKNIEDYYKDAKKFCNKFDFKTGAQKFNCTYTYIEDNAPSKINRELSRINHNCRASHYTEPEFMECVQRAMKK